MPESKSLSIVAAAAAQRAFLQTVEGSLKQQGKELIGLTASVAAQMLVSVSASFVTNFAMSCLKSLLSVEETVDAIAKGVSKLVQEPLSTGIEQLRVADSLQGASGVELSYRASRYEQALSSFDRALSMAEPEERPVVQLMRGLAAARIPGAAHEAKSHLGDYRDHCLELAGRLDAKTDELERAASENARKAETIAVVPGPGVGGGIVGMAVAEPRIRKATLELKSREALQEAEVVKSSSEDLRIAAKSIEILCEILSRIDS